MYVYETGTAHPSGAPVLTPGFSGVCVAQSLVFCVVFYCPLLLWTFVFSVLLRFTTSDYPLCIFGFFL